MPKDKPEVSDSENNDDTEFMKPVLAASQRKEGRFAPLLLYFSFGFVIIFLIWASFAELDELTRADGKVIPSSQIQRIDHLEGGIIEEILVHEGDVVEKGQILLKIDNTIAAARFEEGQETYYRYLTAVARLKAQFSEKEFVIPSDVEKNAPQIANEERIRFEARKQKLENEKAIAEREVEQKRQELIETQNRLEQVKEQFALSQKEVKITEPLVKRGLAAKVDLLRLKRESSEIKGEMNGLKASLERSKAALTQAERRLEQVPIAFRAEDLIELRDAENRLSTAQGSFTTEGFRVTKTEIRSPVRGIVKQLLVATIGGVVQAGEDLIEIVPLEDTLLVEAKVKPADIAFLRPGLPGTVKITAYDFSRYGGLDAELIHISADAIPDETNPNQSFFKIRLRTLGNKLSKSDRVFAIIPGMTASVDIITGKKSVLDYLLKPILKTLDNAMNER